MNVAKVNLDERNLHCEKSVSEGYAGMCETAWVDDDVFACVLELRESGQLSPLHGWIGSWRVVFPNLRPDSVRRVLHLCNVSLP